MITSRKNPKLKTIRQLKGCKGDRVLLEGPHLVEAALGSGWVLETVLATPAFLVSPAGQRLLPRLPVAPEEVTPEALETVADADSPRGLLAVAERPAPGTREVPRVPGGVYVYADRLQDPGNLGALARTAEAAGATALLVAPGGADPYHPRALRASTGSLLRLPVLSGAATITVEALLAPLSPIWVALAPVGGADLYGTAFEGTLLLLVGAEGSGLSPELAARADRVVTIPLQGPVESLNATVAAAVALFELQRQRRSTTAMERRC
jgi:TrmH family RNA methyltransferase